MMKSTYFATKLLLSFAYYFAALSCNKKGCFRVETAFRYKIDIIILVVFPAI